MPFSREGNSRWEHFPMRCSLKLLVPMMVLAAPVAVLAAQSRAFPNVGTPLAQAENPRLSTT